MAVVPIVRGLILCELASVGPRYNLTLTNCFRTLIVHGLPTAGRPFTVVAYLANGVGAFDMQLVVRRLDTMEVVYRTTRPMTFTDRLSEVRFVGHVHGCLFPSPGEYELGLWADRVPLAATPFRIRSPDNPGGSQ